MGFLKKVWGGIKSGVSAVTRTVSKAANSTVGKAIRKVGGFVINNTVGNLPIVGGIVRKVTSGGLKPIGSALSKVFSRSSPKISLPDATKTTLQSVARSASSTVASAINSKIAPISERLKDTQKTSSKSFPSTPVARTVVPAVRTATPSKPAATPSKPAAKEDTGFMFNPQIEK
jgi:hypothetical protein